MSKYNHVEINYKEIMKKATQYFLIAFRETLDNFSVNPKPIKFIKKTFDFYNHKDKVALFNSFLGNSNKFSSAKENELVLNELELMHFVKNKDKYLLIKVDHQNIKQKKMVFYKQARAKTYYISKWIIFNYLIKDDYQQFISDVLVSKKKENVPPLKLLCIATSKHQQKLKAYKSNKKNSSFAKDHSEQYKDYWKNKNNIKNIELSFYWRLHNGKSIAKAINYLKTYSELKITYNKATNTFFFSKTGEYLIERIVLSPNNPFSNLRMIYLPKINKMKIDKIIKHDQIKFPSQLFYEVVSWFNLPPKYLEKTALLDLKIKNILEKVGIK